MSKVIKNQPMKIEFGEYDNFADMIPIEILQYQPNKYYKVLIRWQYLSSDHTIDLWHRTDNDIDFQSFGCEKKEFNKED